MGFKAYDVTDYLETEEDMANYLEACFEEAGNDAAFIAAALGDIARARGMSAIAEATGLTRES
ncbi:MAG: addiction module antidote protein [Aestuariivirga sp.]